MLRLTTFGGLSLESECGPLGGAAAPRLAAAAGATGGEGAAVELLQQSRTSRASIGDRAEAAQCDAVLAALVARA